MIDCETPALGAMRCGGTEANTDSVI
jgi:hypothetical protein